MIYLTGTVALYVFFILLICAPIVPLVISWRRLPKEQGWLAAIVVSGQTASWTFFLVSAFIHDFLGPYYSNRRFGMIYANAAVAVASLVGAARLKGRMQTPLIVSGILLAMIWLFAAAINAVV